MAQLIMKRAGDVAFGCYSERGIISHLVYRVLPQKLDEFLRLLSFPGASANPFADATAADLSEITLFSELDFGTEGFGKPDGAVRFRFRNAAYFIFIEGKVNETYAASCKVRSRRQKKREPLDGVTEAPIPTTAPVAPELTAPASGSGSRTTQGYNSTIRGQLELRYRMVRLYRAYPAALAPLPLGDEPEPEDELESDSAEDELLLVGESPDCLHEIDNVKTFYRDKDGFYAHPNRADPKKLRSWRRVWIKDGVAEVFKHIEGTPEDNIYLLTFTDEATNPFDTVAADLRPRLFDSNWTDCKHRFPWISSSTIENRWDHL